jgi:hypothetical protein
MKKVKLPVLLFSGPLLASLLVCSLFLTVATTPPALASGTITVTSLSGGTGGPDCTLRDAITAANTDAPSGGCPAGNGPDTIILPANATLTFTTPDPSPDGPSAFPTIVSDVIINGNNAVVQRSTANGTPNFRFFVVRSTGKLTLRNLTLANGMNFGNGPSAGIENAGSLNIEKVTFLNNLADDNLGAAIYNVANGPGTVLLNISDSTFDSNSTGSNNAGKGGAIFNAAYQGGKAQVNISRTTFSNNSARLGAALENFSYDPGSQATITINGSTFANNIAPNGAGNSGSIGGAINNESLYGATVRLKVINSTFYQNSALSGGGAINNVTYSTSTAELTVINSSFVNNTGAIGSSIAIGSDNGTGTATALLQNSLFVNPNNTGANCASLSGTFLAGTNNLEYSASGGGASCGTGSTTTSVNPISTVGLASNGGPTQTVALAAGSAALDSGNNTICNDPSTVASRDQRGAARPLGVACDIGAVEAGAIACTPTTVVISTLDDGSCGSLRAVLNTASSGTTITFGLSLPAVITLSGGGLNLPAEVNIQGSCNPTTRQPQITIRGNGLSGPGLLLNGGSTLSGLKLTGFKGRQVWAKGSLSNHFKCVAVSNNALS